MGDWIDCPNCGTEIRANWLNLDGSWDGPEEQRPRMVPRWSTHDCMGTFDTGAAVAFGLMGMATAIQRLTKGDGSRPPK